MPAPPGREALAQQSRQIGGGEDQGGIGRLRQPQSRQEGVSSCIHSVL